ncbi:hypothetical protein [Oleiharenicola lentus]|uniref:hypothetical protein n=1 Tax=Oleiharenicola lentus TaxID=2508720 RepID=UPI003F66A9E2
MPAPDPHPCIQLASSFDELVNARFAGHVNAICWPRTLDGDFAEVVAALNAGEGITNLDEPKLRALTLSAAGQLAVDTLLADLCVLRERGLAPELNCIRAYPRDEDPLVVATDVYSFHADSAPVEADTWLCTYHGAPSEGLPNDQALRRTDAPETRAKLLAIFGGEDGDEFKAFLRENHFDLHYAPLTDAQPYSFGLGHLWRISTENPISPVPPCIHRAPAQSPSDAPRLLLIS